MKKMLYFLVFLSLVFFSNFSTAQETIFKDGDRVCFIGDSHTMSGSYPQFINLLYATRYPLDKVTFFNCGISGDVSDGVLRRMESDILIHNPTWCVLMIGGNDIKQKLYSDANKDQPGIREKQQAALDTYYTDSDSIIRRLLAAQVKVLLLTDPIYDETARIPTEVLHGVNDVTKKLVDNWKDAGRKYNLPVVDIWTILNDLNKKIQDRDSTATIVGRDRNHLGKQGHFVMAYQFLKTQGIPGNVSVVSLDAKNGRLIENINCTITGLQADPASVSFSSLEQSLPFPTEPGFNPDSLVDFTKELNTEVVQVKGLTAGNYRLLIDGVNAGVFSAKDFNTGVNLSNNRATPQYRQADSVRLLFNSYWATVADLRAVKFVEYEHLRNFKNRDDLNEIKAFFTSALEKYKAAADANFGFFTRMYDKYLANKPKEKELEAKLEADLALIRSAGVPKMHAYKIVRVN